MGYGLLIFLDVLTRGQNGFKEMKGQKDTCSYYEHVRHYCQILFASFSRLEQN